MIPVLLGSVPKLNNHTDFLKVSFGLGSAQDHVHSLPATCNMASLLSAAFYS